MKKGHWENDTGRNGKAFLRASSSSAEGAFVHSVEISVL
jgi:hypothetical protein